MLESRDLTLHYGGSRILDGVSIAAKRGEVACVMGTNGVGKTSLMKAISGTHPRSGGEVIFDGERLPKLPAHRLARMGVEYVPQGRMIFPLLDPCAKTSRPGWRACRGPSGAFPSASTRCSPC
jgi:urea transport system ATP-binding protein